MRKAILILAVLIGTLFISCKSTSTLIDSPNFYSENVGLNVTRYVGYTIEELSAELHIRPMSTQRGSSDYHYLYDVKTKKLIRNAIVVKNYGGCIYVTYVGFDKEHFKETFITKLFVEDEDYLLKKWKEEGKL